MVIRNLKKYLKEKKKRKEKKAGLNTVALRRIPVTPPKGTGYPRPVNVRSRSASRVYTDDDSFLRSSMSSDLYDSWDSSYDSSGSSDYSGSDYSGGGGDFGGGGSSGDW